jgi:N6-L-threonylcarbamoyladenine synthase
VGKTVALARHHKVKLIAVGGGVSANNYMRARLSDEAARCGIEVLFPPFDQSLDNAAMVARMGYELYKKGRVADLRLAAVPALGMG